MTTYQIAHRLLRHCTPSDPAALTLSQAMELAGAISAGLGYFFRFAPGTMRQTQISATLDGPTTKSSLPVLANSLAVTSGSPFTIGQRGCTIAIEGDTRPNEIVSTTGWLNSYQGASGSKSATVYGDCFPVRTDVVEKMTSDPWLLLESGRTQPLTRVSTDDEANQSFRSQGIRTGTPTHYAIANTGDSRDSATHFLLRVWPFPDDPTILKFVADLEPDTVDETNVVQTPIDLPLSPEKSETILLPLCEREMLRSSLYKNVEAAIVSQIESAATRAERQLAILPRNKGHRRARVGTPRGF